MSEFPPEARLLWLCLDCTNELEPDGDTLTCETCEHVFVITSQNHARFAPERTDAEQ